MTKPDTPFPKHWRYYIVDQMGGDRGARSCLP